MWQKSTLNGMHYALAVKNYNVVSVCQFVYNRFVAWSTIVAPDHIDCFHNSESLFELNIYK